MCGRVRASRYAEERGRVYHKKVDEVFRRDASFRAYAASWQGGLIAMTEVGAGVYAGLRCADCAFSEFVLNEESGMFEGACARGYTLADPHVHVSPDRFFAKNPRALVPVTDPYGREYLRTRNICTRFAPREG